MAIKKGVEIKRNDRQCDCRNISGDVIFSNNYDISCESEGCKFGKYHWHCKDCGGILEDIDVDMYEKYHMFAFTINIKRGTYYRHRFAADMSEQDARNYRAGYEIRKDGKYYDYYEIFMAFEQLINGYRRKLWVGNKKEDIYQFVLEIHSRHVDEIFVLDKKYMKEYLKKICSIANFWSSRDDDRRIQYPLHDQKHLERIACYLACLFIAEEYYLYNNTEYGPGSLFLLDAIRQVVLEGKGAKETADMYKREKTQYMGPDYQKYIRKRIRIF